MQQLEITLDHEQFKGATSAVLILDVSVNEETTTGEVWGRHYCHTQKYLEVHDATIIAFGDNDAEILSIEDADHTEYITDDELNKHIEEF